MFDKKVQGEALILDDEGAGNVTDTDFHGVDWDHHKYIVEVRPDGGEPRYDPKLIRGRSKQERSAQAEALLNGAPAPAASGVESGEPAGGEDY